MSSDIQITTPCILFFYLQNFYCTSVDRKNGRLSSLQDRKLSQMYNQFPMGFLKLFETWCFSIFNAKAGSLSKFRHLQWHFNDFVNLALCENVETTKHNKDDLQTCFINPRHLRWVVIVRLYIYIVFYAAWILDFLFFFIKSPSRQWLVIYSCEFCKSSRCSLKLVNVTERCHLSLKRGRCFCLKFNINAYTKFL